MVEEGCWRDVGEGLAGPGVHAGCLSALRRVLPGRVCLSRCRVTPQRTDRRVWESAGQAQWGSLLEHLQAREMAVETEAGSFGEVCVDSRASWKLAF